MNKSNSKGITLIALVITIIVLLILAGVTISMVVGDNGILSNASKAGKQTALAEAKEKVEMAMAEAVTNYLAGTDTTSTSTYEAAKTALTGFTLDSDSKVKFAVQADSNPATTYHVYLVYNSDTAASSSNKDEEGILTKVAATTTTSETYTFEWQ